MYRFCMVVRIGLEIIIPVLIAVWEVGIASFSALPGGFREGCTSEAWGNPEKS